MKMMDYRIKINEEDKVTKVQQIANQMIQDIEKGILKRNAQVASINEFSRAHHVARETVEKAYKILRKDGYLDLGKQAYRNAEKANRQIM